jgi:excisionase family DNA binding protein
MVLTMSQEGLVQANEVERRALAGVAAFLECQAGGDLRLVNEAGDQIDLPATARGLLEQLVQVLAEGRPAGILALPEELSIQRAADLLDVPAAHVVRLIDDGEIATVPSGEHRRIRFEDLMEYKVRRDAARRDGLRELTRMSQEMGLYDLPVERT